MTQLITQAPWENIFQELSEQAFVLQSIPEMQPNIFVANMMTFFYQLPQFNNHELNYYQQGSMNHAISRYLQLMYDCYFDNLYEEEITNEVTHDLINIINML